VNSESIAMAEIENREEKSSSAHTGSARASAKRNGACVLRTAAELEELRAVWAAWQGHPHSDLDFLLMLCQSREEILSPYVIAVYRDGKPEALLAGRLENRQLSYRIGYLPVFRTKARSLTFQYGALRGNGSDENCKEMILAILGSLKAGEADLATLHYPSTDSFLYKRALSIPGYLSRDFAAVPQPHHLMRLAGTIEEVFRGFSGSHRQSIKSHGRKIEKKLGERLKVRCFRDPGELETAISLIEEVAKKTYHRGLGVGFDDSARSRQIFQFYAENGQLRMYVVLDGDKPIAFWVGVVYGGWFHSDHTGFDSEYRDCSPGTYLQVKMIEDFCREGLHGIDFGLGDAEYKRRFGNETFEESPVSLFAPRPKGMAIKAAHSLTGGVSSVLKEILARMNLLMKLKKRWRDHLQQKGTANA
jgi:Acetyltransferase (GNAT) domain